MKIGLISDTHIPDRWRAIPESIVNLFAGVDLILHAGDVGDLSVLDQLGLVAPVIAVHGNDETSIATNALPYLQTLMIEGHRLVLTHAHYPDRAEELASRVDGWQTHLQRRADFAKANGAKIVIYGHLHVAMHLMHDGILLINPGAIASGNHWLKQTTQTVAILTLERDQAPDVVFYDVNTLQVHKPYFDESGFDATANHYDMRIADEGVYEARNWIWDRLMPQDHQAVYAALNDAAYLCWDGHQETYGWVDILRMLKQQPSVHPAVWQVIESHPVVGAIYKTLT